MKAKIKINMQPTAKIIKRLGLDAAGDVQRFHTKNVLDRMVKYMPYTTGATIKLTRTQTDINRPEIITATPYAERIFTGETKSVPPRKLNYNKTYNKQAGPRWDRALVAREGDALVADLQRYIDRKAGKK